MISKTALAWQHPLPWQQILANAVRDPAVLLDQLKLPMALLPAAQAASRQFPLRVPSGYLARMEVGNPDDPLLRQILPLQAEMDMYADDATDPVGDQAAMVAPGVLHKYTGRVLLLVTGACAIHCRYCFRRHFPYAEANPSTQQWQPALHYIAHDPSISEVILSGGDPLSMSDSRLAELVAQLQVIPHVQRLRVHTRLPVVVPERVTDGLLAWLTGSRLKPVLVLHINHPNEIDAALRDAVQRLRAQQVVVLNQSVLLKGVNDDVRTLVALSEGLFAAGILPYYLHQLDRVQGARHFAVDAARARSLLNEVRGRLPGYLLPRLVQEIPGMDAKLPM
jgi:EF-P beta-lysylation protein EpmB